MSFARSRGSSCDQGAAAISSSRRRASARWPCFCQKRHIEKATPIATGGSGAATARSRTARMSSCSSSRRSSQRRCSDPDISSAARPTNATYQSRWRPRIRSASPSASSRSAAYSRIVSSSRKRGSPSVVSSTLSRLWSTSAMSPSRMSVPISDDGPQTASAEARSQPLAKTDSRSSNRLPPSSSRS